MNIQDEFVRPPRWMLTMWGSTKDGDDVVSVQNLILVSPFEANIIVPLLRQRNLRSATLHRFAPRTRRDQSELLTSDLTFWTGSRPFLSSNDLQLHLKFGTMAMTLFGSSTCLQSREINSEGFLVRSSSDIQHSRLSESGRRFLKRMYAKRNWKRSSVAATRSLVPLRNMSSFFQRSDLESILFSK